MERHIPPERPPARRLVTPTRRRAAHLDQHARAILATLTTHEKLGQLLVPVIFPAGPHDLCMTEELRALIAEGGIGGYFITSAGADARQVRAFVQELQAAAPLPLLVATDFEGGEWNFIQSAVGARPAPSAIGASGDSVLAFEKGREDARLLTSVGINSTFAPTVDLLLNPNSPILQSRTFGADPARVTRLADAYLDGLATHGIAGCLKHFPGLGRAARDPHDALPVILSTAGELRARELLPYRDLLASRSVPLVMTTHLQMPALDRDLPTSLSPAVIQGLLRRELGYDGLVISDSLAMGALARYALPRAALLAFQAGTDLLLGMPDIATTRATLEALHAALAGGAFGAPLLEASVLRILRFKLEWLGAAAARDQASVTGEDVA